jgi:hypothetical protein
VWNPSKYEISGVNIVSAGPKKVRSFGKYYKDNPVTEKFYSSSKLGIKTENPSLDFLHIFFDKGNCINKFI